MSTHDPGLAAFKSQVGTYYSDEKAAAMREAAPDMLAALKNGRGATIDGTWGSSGSLVAAALGLHAPRAVLVVIAHPRDVDGWVEDLASFAGLRPVVFPAWDNRPSESTLLDEIAGQRLRVLKQLEAGEPPRYLLATIQALIQPVPSPAELAQNRRVLRVHESIDPDELAAWLVERGFRRTDAVELPAEFSRRGGILDIFSADAEAPYRVEFFGDEIESIRQFSPHTQRSLQDLQTIELLGAAAEGDRAKQGNGDRSASLVKQDATTQGNWIGA